MAQAAASGSRLLELEIQYKKHPDEFGTAKPGAGLRLSRRKVSISPSPHASATIPRAHLFSADQIAAGTRVRVEANKACATQSLMRGSGLTLGTAGIASTFSIQARVGGWVGVRMCACVCMRISLSLSLSHTHTHIYVSIYVSIYLCIYLSIYVYSYLSINLSIYPSDGMALAIYGGHRRPGSGWMA